MVAKYFTKNYMVSSQSIGLEAYDSQCVSLVHLFTPPGKAQAVTGY